MSGYTATAHDEGRVTAQLDPPAGRPSIRKSNRRFPTEITARSSSAVALLQEQLKATYRDPGSRKLSDLSVRQALRHIDAPAQRGGKLDDRCLGRYTASVQSGCRSA